MWMDHLHHTIPFILYHTIYTILYHLYHTIPFTPYYTIYTILYHLHHTMPFIPWYTTYTILYHLYHTIPFIPYYTIYTILYHLYHTIDVMALATDEMICVHTAFSHLCAAAEEILDHFRDRFIKDTASSAIVYELKHKDVIASGDVAMIERKADVTQQNQYLHECLMRKCTKEALMEVCNVMSAVRGNPKMNALGKDMRRHLKGICHV